LSHVLDRCIWHALSRRQAAFSVGTETARRYDTEYAPFAATLDNSPESLAALHGIVPPGGAVVLFTPEELDFPEHLVAVRRALVTQVALVPGAIAAAPLPATARALGASDAAAVKALVALTQPGPFAARTMELGRYLGVFADDTLVALTGERMSLDGFVEISAVCTHPEHRGKGYAASLIAATADAAFARGDTPFLHAFATNTSALALYRKLGFSIRANLQMAVAGRVEDHVRR
jgi:ribosomal protein S18 acetylase RimI-like enzyme